MGSTRALANSRLSAISPMTMRAAISGQGKHRGTPQDATESFREFPIGDGMGRHSIHRPAQGIRKDQRVR